MKRPRGVADPVGPRIYPNRLKALAFLGRMRDEAVIPELRAILADGGRLYHGRPPRITVKNTVGCGDSMLAGFAYGISLGLPILESFRIALAVSAASAMCLLTGAFEEEDYRRILPEVGIEELK